jgi:hypothetical protein
VKSVVTPIAAVFHIDTIELMIALKSSVTLGSCYRRPQYM